MKIALLSIFLLALSCGAPKNTTNGDGKIPLPVTETKKVPKKPTIYKDLILELKNPNSIEDVKALVTNSGLQWDKVAFENDANNISIIKVPEDKTTFWIDKLKASNEFKNVVPNNQTALNSMIKKAKAAFFSIRKTECFGDCPVYEVTVTEKGNVTYVGKKYVSVIGTKKFTLTDKQLVIFKEKLANADFNTFKKKYDDPSLKDLSNTFITHKDKQVQIRLWRGIPKQLTSVQSYIVDILYDKKFLE